jgi:ABC-2 type transport system ATP-binding protein
MEIRTNGLTKHYRRRVTALAGVTLHVPAGMYGLLGANGAGKTTLMRILAGILRPTAGSVRAGEHDLTTAAGRRAVQQALGYLPQELGLYPDLTARRFLDYIALLKGIGSAQQRRDQIDELLALTALTDVADRKIGGFSGGMKRRVGIAQALLGDPALLIVDEPTAGLDPEERIRFRNLLAQLAGDRTVLLSTHIVEDVASTCRQLAILATGRVVYAGLTDGVVDAARDRTWVVRLPVGVTPQGDLAVVSALQQADGVAYRVVSSGAYPVEGEPVEPTLEDGYLALMRSVTAAGDRAAVMTRGDRRQPHS